MTADAADGTWVVPVQPKCHPDDAAGVSERERLLTLLEDDALYLDTGSYKLEFCPERAVDAILAAGFSDKVERP